MEWMRDSKGRREEGSLYSMSVLSRSPEQCHTGTFFFSFVDRRRETA